MKQAVILFHSTNYAIWADRELSAAQIPHKLAPVPRDMSSDCGYCVRIRSADLENAKDVLDKGGVQFSRIEKLI